MTDYRRALADLAYANASLISRLMRSEKVVEAARRLVTDNWNHGDRLRKLEAAVIEYDEKGSS